MKDFKFTEAERGDIEDAMYDLQWKEEIDVVLDRIETLIQSRADAVKPTPSIPTHYGNSVAGVSANEVLLRAHRHYDDELGITWQSAIDAMTTYAASVCADKDREIRSLTEKVMLYEEKMDVQNDVIKSAQAEVEEKKTEVSRLINVIESYDDELTASKAEVERLSKDIADEVINRAESIENSLLRSELAESNRRVAEIEGAILWALGYVGSFPVRKSGQGPYWWRAELEKRSNIKPK